MKNIWQHLAPNTWESNASDWTDEHRAGYFPVELGIRIDEVNWYPMLMSPEGPVLYWLKVIVVPSDIREKLGLPKTLYFRVYNK